MCIRNALWIAAVVVVVARLIHTTTTPEGEQPIGVCETMDPGYGGTPQTSKCPFRLFLNKYDIFMNERVMFTIEQNASHKLRGFMAQARDMDGKPIGQFIATTLEMKAVDCAGGERNMATHTNDEPKELVQMVWKPPEDYVGTCTFFATVVIDKDTYWISEPAEKVLSIKYG